jgi:cytochrome c553
MKKIIVLLTICLFSIMLVSSVSASKAIKKAHNEAKDGKGIPKGQTEMTCDFCHDKNKAGHIEKKKNLGFGKKEANRASLKTKEICKECHKDLE